MAVDTVARPPVAGGSLPTCQARFGRSRPLLVAIKGENAGTKLTDFAIPYEVLAASGGAEVVTIGTQSRVLPMSPAPNLWPAVTVQPFDGRFPEGAVALQATRISRQ